MRLIIVRHGKAEADSSSGRDEDRELKKRGQRQSRWLGSHFAEQAPGMILSSGHARAMATAELIAEATGAALRHETRLELGHSASDALEAIAEHAGASGERGLMVVGHNPQLGHLLWVLTQGAPARDTDLKTGEAVVLEFHTERAIGEAEVLERVRLPEEG